MSKIKSEELDRLYEAILSLRTPEECAKFFDDLCTIKELQDLSQRLAVAEMLNAGRSYSDICESTGASTATISRVSKALNYGSDGYRLILDRRKNGL